MDNTDNIINNKHKNNNDLRAEVLLSHIDSMI